jgi:hypothetical protein
MMNILLDSTADLDSFQAAVGAVEKIAVISQQSPLRRDRAENQQG